MEIEANKKDKPKIKICGLRREEDVAFVNLFPVQYAGFVFAPSKRQISAATAEHLRKRLRQSILAVGVFVNAVPEDIVQLCRKEIIQMIQLHGQEDAAYIQMLRQQVTVPIIKAVRVQSREDILKAQQFDCDGLLLDTYVSGMAGGSGKSFDYRQIPLMKKPFFLAGGLNPENVQTAIRSVHPTAVDVSSGVETNGWKDAEKIRRFVEAVQTV